MDSLTYLSLYSGGGGLDIGFKLAVPNARAVGYVERDAAAIALLVDHMQAKQLDDAPLWSDSATFESERWSGLVDFVIGGFPCQPWSVAGRQQGLDDERWLWPHIREILRTVQPRGAFLENVPGLFRGGLGPILSDLAALGFSAEWTTLQATAVGASHRRERVFILAYRNREPSDVREWGQHQLDRGIQVMDDSESQRQQHISMADRTPDGDVDPTLDSGGTPEGRGLADSYGGEPTSNTGDVSKKRSVPEGESKSRHGSAVSQRSSRTVADTDGGLSDVSIETVRARRTTAVDGDGDVGHPGHDARGAGNGEQQDEQQRGQGRRDTETAGTRESSAMGDSKIRENDQRKPGGLEEATGSGRRLDSTAGDASGSLGNPHSTRRTTPRKRNDQHSGAEPETGVDRVEDSKRHGSGRRNREYEGRSPIGDQEPSDETEGANIRMGDARGERLQGSDDHTGAPGGVQQEPGERRSGLADADDSGDSAPRRGDHGHRTQEVSGRQEQPQLESTGSGKHMGDTDHAGLQRWRRYGKCGNELPAWPPGPTDTDAWEEVLRERPDLAPAKSEVRGVDDGLARGMDLSRTDKLKILGNGVVPQQAALAFTILAERLAE